jgi:hypothetical protein
LWLAQGSPAGCGALKLHAKTRIAEEATARGMRTLRLETNRALVEAKRLYETAGFREIEAFNT